MKLNLRHLIASFAILTVLSGRVMGLCNHKTIHKIVQTWGNNIPPADVLKRSVGVTTYVYLSPTFLKRDDPKVYCLATKLSADETTTTDIYVYRDLFTTYTVKYYKYENSGKITNKSEGIADENQFILSYKNHVMVFWQCEPKGNTLKNEYLVGIAVDVEHINDQEAQTEIQEAKKALEALGLATGADMNPCTPQLLHRANKS